VTIASGAVVGRNGKALTIELDRRHLSGIYGNSSHDEFARHSAGTLPSSWSF
jgi:hypothetical protein